MNVICVLGFTSLVRMCGNFHIMFGGIEEML